MTQLIKGELRVLCILLLLYIVIIVFVNQPSTPYLGIHLIIQVYSLDCMIL